MLLHILIDSNYFEKTLSFKSIYAIYVWKCQWLNFKVQIKYLDNIHITIRDNYNRLNNLNNQHWNLTILLIVLIDKPRFEYNNSFIDIINKK